MLQSAVSSKKFLERTAFSFEQALCTSAISPCRNDIRFHSSSVCLPTPHKTNVLSDEYGSEHRQACKGSSQNCSEIICRLPFHKARQSLQWVSAFFENIFILLVLIQYTDWRVIHCYHWYSSSWHHFDPAQPLNCHQSLFSLLLRICIHVSQISATPRQNARCPDRLKNYPLILRGNTLITLQDMIRRKLFVSLCEFSCNYFTTSFRSIYRPIQFHCSRYPYECHKSCSTNRSDRTRIITFASILKDLNGKAISKKSSGVRSIKLTLNSSTIPRDVLSVAVKT